MENLSQRVTDLDRQLIVQVKEAEMLGNRVNDLEARLATQGKLLAEREFENNQLRQANAAAERTMQQLRDQIAQSDSGKLPALEKLKTEKAALEEQLRVTRDERSKLQRDINAIQQQAESNWATERMENALLRERINDIAAEVAKLAMQLEGPNSPIEAMLAARPRRKAGQGRQRRRHAANDTGLASAPPGRHARRAHPGAAVARLPRPPAGRLNPAVISGRKLDTDGPRFVNRGLWRHASSQFRPDWQVFDEAQHSRAHSSAGERSLHTGEVQGSIPCAPTSLRSLRELRLGKPVPVYRSEASEGCRAEGGPYGRAVPLGRRRWSKKKAAEVMFSGSPSKIVSE